MSSLDKSPRDFRAALVVGTVRNSSKAVRSDLLRILSEMNKILPTCAFIVESDSQDNTVEVLHNLAHEDSRIRYVTLGELSPKIPDRIERIRHCRNVYVTEIRKNPIYSTCDLVLVVDFDGINTKITSNSLELALRTELKWDALAANQSGRYYDILALRHPLWSPNNCISQTHLLSSIVGEKAAWKLSVEARMLRIPVAMSPILVDSAFGGLCLYQRWVFEICNYTMDDSLNVDDNEHVSLNKAVRSKGGSIFIHPGLINAGWTTHSLDGISVLRSAKRAIHGSPLRYLLPILRRLTILVTRN